MACELWAYACMRAYARYHSRDSLTLASSQMRMHQLWRCQVVIGGNAHAKKTGPAGIANGKERPAFEQEIVKGAHILQGCQVRHSRVVQRSTSSSMEAARKRRRAAVISRARHIFNEWWLHARREACLQSITNAFFPNIASNPCATISPIYSLPQNLA